MRIHCISPHDDVQLLTIDVDQELDILRPLGKGLPYVGAWTPLAASRLLKPRKRKHEELCDLTAISAYVDIPVLSARAKNALEPVLGSQAQWLPLAFDEAEYWILNCLRALDVLDKAQSEIRYFAHGPVMSIHTYAFQPDVIADEWLFKALPKPYDVLVTEKFHDLVKEQDLTGFYFQPVWDSGYPSFPARPSQKELLTRPDVFGPGGILLDHEEFWPPEWKEQAQQMKRQVRKSAKA